jgi:hypothetical protein
MVQQKSSSMMVLRDERMLASVIIAAIDTLLVLFVSLLDAFLVVVFFVLSCSIFEFCVCQVLEQFFPAQLKIQNRGWL